MEETDFASKEFGSFHIAADNQTPIMIANIVGCDVRDIIAINREQYPQLTYKSKLMEGTQLVVPYDGTKDSDGTENDDLDLTPATNEKLLGIYKALRKLDINKFFGQPVSDDEAPLYSKLIRSPMTFHQIRRKLDNGEYITLLDLKRDFVLLCKNAIVYNDTESEVAIAARVLLSAGIKLFESMGPRAALPEVHVAKKPDSRFRWNHGDDKISLGLLTNNKIGRDVPQLGEALFGNSQHFQLPLNQQSGSEVNDPVPVTDLYYGHWQTFGVTHDASVANIDPLDASDLVYDSRSPDSYKTDFKSIAHMTPWTHALKIAAHANSISATLHGRRRLLSTLGRLGEGRTTPTDCSVAGPAKPSPATHPARSVSAMNSSQETPDSASDRKITSDHDANSGSAIQASSSIPVVTGPPDAELQGTRRALSKLIKHQANRLLTSNNPTRPLADERAVAEKVRLSLVKLIKSVSPKDIVSVEAVRAAMGIKNLTPTKETMKRKRKVTVPPADDAKLVRQIHKKQKLLSKMSTKSVGVCLNCNASGIQWTHGARFTKNLCHSCGLYTAHNRKPRPIQFETDAHNKNGCQLPSDSQK